MEREARESPVDAEEEERKGVVVEDHATATRRRLDVVAEDQRPNPLIPSGRGGRRRLLLLLSLSLSREQ